MFIINKGIQVDLPLSGHTHLEEQEFRSDEDEVKFWIFRDGDYLGSLAVRKVGEKVGVYIPSIPASTLTPIGTAQFNLDFRAETI